jgi:lycopene cyclase domain-containing protein
VPLEEYLFFLLQPLLVGLLFLRLRWSTTPPPHHTPTAPPPYLRPTLGTGWLAVSVAGAALILFGPDDALYAGLILAWAAPALAGLSLIGTRHLWANLRPALLTLTAASVYLWLIDRLAIGLGIWTINPQYSLGEVAGLPIEEALFFSITTWLCVHGLATMLPEREPVPTA